jgi:hypothetical protein
VLQALDEARPHLRSQGNDVELLGVVDGVVHLRLRVSDRGRASPTSLRLAVEKAVGETAPDVTAFEVEIVPEREPALVQLRRGTRSREQQGKTDDEIHPSSFILHPSEALPVEKCELCGAGLAADHEHVVEASTRKLVCACGPCSILFCNMGGTYRRVPRRVRPLPDFRMTDAQWDSLMIPIQLAFFFQNTAAERVVAVYPSPAGPTESLLSLEPWDEIVQANPALRDAEPDVEALLVNRTPNRMRDPEYFLVPIDECYRLTGLVRAHWRGLSGGTEVWEEIERFFAALRARSAAAGEAAHA